MYVDLRTQWGVRASAPVITEQVAVSELGGVTMTLLGVDPIAEAPYRSFLGTGAGGVFGTAEVMEFMDSPFTLFVDERTARSHNLATGDSLTLVFAGRTQKFRILAVITGGDSESGTLPSHLLITDIRDAQDFLNRYESLDRIDLFLNEDRAAATVQMLEETLPFSVQIEPASAAYDTLRQLTGAFRLNLEALSLLAVVVGTFLVYNTLSFNVMKSRRSLGILRALGMTRPQIFALILSEALLLGIVGSMTGILLGRLLATGLVELVNRAYLEIYAIQTVQGIALPATVVWKATLVGVGCALCGAGMPAVTATRVEISSELQNRGAAAEATIPAARNFWVGLLALLGSVALLLPAFPLPFAFAGIFAGLVGVSFLVPILLRIFIRGALWLVKSQDLPFARMSLRQPLRRLGQTSVAVAALMMSLSVVIGIGSMVGSFRTSVESWLEQVIVADIYLTPTASETKRGLTPSQLQELRSWPEIARVTTLFETQARSLELGVVDLIVLSDDDAKASRIYMQQMPTETNPWDEAVRQGGLVVNEPMSLKHDIQAGDSLTWITDRATTPFPVVGVFKSYDAVATVLMDEEVYLRHWTTAGNTRSGYLAAGWIGLGSGPNRPGRVLQTGGGFPVSDCQSDAARQRPRSL